MGKVINVSTNSELEAKLKIAVRALSAIRNSKGTVEDMRELADRAKFNIKHYGTFKKT